MKIVVAGLVAALVLAAPQASAKEPLVPKRLLGIVGGATGARLAKLDARTLRPISRMVDAGTGVSYVARSPGRGALVAFTGGRRGELLRFLDLDRMRWTGDMSVSGSVSAAIWRLADRLVVVTAGRASAVVIMDPAARRIRARRNLGGTVVATNVGADRLVAVVAPFDRIGEAWLVVVDERGRVRTVELPNVRAGTEVVSTDPYVGRHERPAVAVDSRGERAVVLTARGTAVEVDLASLATRSHTLALSRADKGGAGSDRSALWISPNTIAVTGSDVSEDGGETRWTPAGLKLVNVSDWSIRILETATVQMTYAWGTLLAHGGVWDAQTRRSVYPGVAGYGTDGALRFRLFEGETIGPAAIVGWLAYFTDDNATRFTIVDTNTGAVVATAETAVPTFPLRLWLS